MRQVLYSILLFYFILLFILFILVKDILFAQY